MNLEKYIKHPWEFIDTLSGEKIKEELLKEIGDNHPLFNVNCEPIAKRIDNDDVLFEINPHLCDFAIVHLTWSGKKESDSSWPHVELFVDAEDLFKERLVKDYKNYIGG